MIRWLGLADLDVVVVNGVVVDSVAWACRSQPGFADLGVGLPSFFLLFSGVVVVNGVRYIITSFSFPSFSSKSCQFGGFILGLIGQGWSVWTEASMNWVCL